MGASTCEAAYTHGAAWVDEMTDYLSETMEYAYNYVKENIPNVSMVKPEGLYLAWFDLSKLGMTNEEVEEAFKKIESFSVSLLHSIKKRI